MVELRLGIENSKLIFYFNILSWGIGFVWSEWGPYATKYTLYRGVTIYWGKIIEEQFKHSFELVTEELDYMQVFLERRET